MNRDVPAIVREQYAAIQDYPDIAPEEAERRFPEMLDWLRERVSLVDVIRDCGVDLKPISPDVPDVWVDDCPSCAGPALVKGE